MFVAVVSKSFAEVRVVAQYGGSAPDTASLFDSFDTPILNDNGEVAFTAFIDDLDGATGLWSEGDGIGLLRNVVLMGDTAPDTGGQTIESFVGAWHLNDLGDVAFVAALDDSTQVVYTDRDRPTSSLTKVARTGEPAFDTDVGRNYNFGFNLLDFGGIHSGTTFRTSLSSGDPPNNFPSHAIYNEGFSVVLGKVAEFDDPAPGTVKSTGVSPAEFDNLHFPTTNNSGHVVFSAETNASTGGVAVGDEGIWTTSPGGTLRAVALQGESAPGTPYEFSNVFGRLSPSFDSMPLINDDGDIVFMATLLGFIEGKLRAGVWVERDGVVEKVAYESEIAQGTSSKFELMDFDPLIDGNGLTSFVATLDDGRDGLWKESSPGNLELVAIQDDPAPETGLDFLNILDVAMNASGQVAFLSQLSDLSSGGLFATDPAGVLQKIVATGDLLDLDGTPILVETINFAGLIGSLFAAGNGVSNGFNDSGQVAFIVSGEVQDEFGGTGEYIDAIVVSDVATTSAGLPGDYNNNGVIDAADYTVWRDALTAGSTSLTNDLTPGTVDESDFLYWRAHFGETLGSGSGAGQAAGPEPSALAILLTGTLAIVLRRRAAVSSTRQSVTCAENRPFRYGL
jgi:hypothetical protein